MDPIVHPFKIGRQAEVKAFDDLVVWNSAFEHFYNALHHVIRQINKAT